MPCSPNDNTINPPIVPPIGLGGFAPITVPFPAVDIPTDWIEDIYDLVNKLGLLFPSGLFKPNIDNFTKDLFDLISDLLSQIAPFLSFYNFIMALFKLILCIIEVLCAIPNPFKIASAMIKLFTECLPPFLNLFPWLALIAMIIALILLIIALIEYIIATIIAIIEEIIRNIMILANGLSFQDVASTLAAINKLAELLCFIQNILAIFIALAAIIAIIQALAQLAGATVCDEDTAACCTADVCPPFIKNSPWSGTAGTMLYNKQVGPDFAAMFAGLDPPLTEEMIAMLSPPDPPRRERWQLFDDSSSAPYDFADITRPVIDFSSFPPLIATFWPEGMTYNSETPSTKAPYNVDLRMLIDPSQFNPSDTDGARYMRVNGCITVRRPLNFTVLFNNFPNPNEGNNGVLYIEGGLVFEDDGTTPYMVNGSQATLNTFIHEETGKGTTLPNDTITFSNIEYTFKPVYGVLMGHTLITAGCLPEVAAEKRIMNAVLVSEDIRAVVEKLQPAPVGTKAGLASVGVLPNVGGAQLCAINALSDFRKDVSIPKAAVFQASILACLTDLREQCVAVVTGAVLAGASQFKSQVSLDPSLQFTSRAITATVVLKDPGNTNLAQNLPLETQEAIQSKIKGEVTLGDISGFVYDAETGSFNAKITSEIAGDGSLTVTFNNKVLSVVVPGNQSTSTIEENSLPYTFIDTPTDPTVRRDPTDVSGGGQV
jgi:hypothetical protein